MSKHLHPVDHSFSARSHVAVTADWEDKAAIRSLVRLMQKMLSPDLLTGPYARKNAEMIALNPTMGHCSAASEAIWHILGGNASPYRDHWAYDTPAARRRQQRGEKRAAHDETHHWLQIPGSNPSKRGTVIDATAAQYRRIKLPNGKTTSREIPHAYGTAAGFMTRYPSARAQCLIDRLANHLRRSPIKGLTVKPALIRSTDAAPNLPFRASHYSKQPDFYQAALTPKKRTPKPSRAI
ncbi:MAG: hypothetical protein Alpg2KO_24680 [Alphaproteobacteria bacterium]